MPPFYLIAALALGSGALCCGDIMYDVIQESIKEDLAREERSLKRTLHQYKRN